MTPKMCTCISKKTPLWVLIIYLRMKAPPKTCSNFAYVRTVRMRLANPVGGMVRTACWATAAVVHPVHPLRPAKVLHRAQAHHLRRQVVAPRHLLLARAPVTAAAAAAAVVA